MLVPSKIAPLYLYIMLECTYIDPSELKSREVLDKYLSRALNLELENGKLSVIDSSKYVLTLDYAIKMLNIHERFKCGMPVIIEGETGVGKTALVEMLSKLWNEAYFSELKKQKGRLYDFFHNILCEYTATKHEDPPSSEVCKPPPPSEVKIIMARFYT